MNPIERGIAAKALVDSPLFNEAFENVRKSLYAGLEALPLSNPESARAAEDYRVCLKLLRAVHDNIIGALQSGKVEQFRLNQIEEARKNPRKGVFGGIFR